MKKGLCALFLLPPFNMKRKLKPALPDDKALLEIFRTHSHPLRPGAILEIARLSRHSRKELDKALQKLVSQKLLARLPGGFLSLPQQSACVTGEYNASPNGYGTVRISEPESMRGREIFISPFQGHDAWHKDIVNAVILPGRSGNKGRILHIVKRTQTVIPAILEQKNKRALVFRAADSRLNIHFRTLPPKGIPGALEPGDLALLKPEKMLDRTMWQAEILEWLGPADRIAAQEAIVKQSQGVPATFPALALEQAASLPKQPQESDIPGRDDLRHIPFVTIDGADARDFDDAIHVERTSAGFLLRVAIADVSHYVLPDARPDSLDGEARQRGNSWYFPSSVEPMLPAALSNGLCSLKPHEDRLAMLVEMPFTRDGEPLQPRFAPIVMRSGARLVYEDVAKFFDGNDKPPIGADARICGMLQDARALYEILARRRRQRGTLDFQMPEPAYTFDNEGRLTEMSATIRTDANQLIEEFMIAANEAVAACLAEKGCEFLYRVHPEPEQERLKILFETLRLTVPEVLPADFPQKNAGALHPEAIQTILARAAGTPQEYVVNRLCLRSMGQARYQPQNIGHFGLASPAYCHFTSPIRRYADLLTHRALKAALGISNTAAPDSGALARTGDKLNALERRATECEREMTKRMSCLALAGQEGRVLPGTVSGVTDFGVFVEFKELPAEGLMRISDLGNDWFELDQARQRLVGQASGRVWQLGQAVSCSLAGVDLEKREIRLKPAVKTAKLPKNKRASKKADNAFSARRRRQKRKK